MTAPFWLRSGIRNVWCFLTFKYSLIVILCFGAMIAQMHYRVPGHFIFLLLPWIGIAVGALSFILLINHLLHPLTKTSPDPFRQTLWRIEGWATAIILIFFVYSFLIYLNGKLDQSPPTEQTSQVLVISGNEIDLGGTIPYVSANLRSWKNPERIEQLFLTGDEQRTLWGGEAIIVQVHQGYFHIPWVSGIAQDKEKYDREILNLVPTASSAWSDLSYLYLHRRQWKDATETAHEYLKLYPNDYGFARNVGASLATSGNYKEGVSFIEYVIKKEPTNQDLQLLGWTLSHQGDNARAAEVLESSITLDPDDWQAYYELGHVYAAMGKYLEAVDMFEKVMARKPHFPEVEQKIASLQTKIAARKSYQQSQH